MGGVAECRLSAQTGRGLRRQSYLIMYYVYIIQSQKTGNLYKGKTADLRRRMDEHNRGKVSSTKASRPWDLKYYEAHLTEKLARQAEIFYKTSQGKRQIVKKLGIE